MSESTARKGESDTVTADGLYLRELTPGKNPRGAFLLLHGMESHSGWFMDLAGRLVNAGWAVVAFDRAGWGRSPGRRGHLSSYRNFVETTSRIASGVRERYGSVHLAGMSWGGMAALYLGLRRGWLFDSLSCLSPGISSKKDLPLSGKIRMASDFFGFSHDSMVTPLFEPGHFTGVPEWREFIASDTDRVRSVSTGFCLETLKMRRFVKETAGRRLLPPTLCLLAGDDVIVDNAATAAVCRSAGAVVEGIPGAAHTLLFEKPGQTADILARHAAASLPSVGKKGGVWVLGAGAVGGALAALLSFGGVPTGVLVKPEYLADMRRDGFTLHSGNGSRVARDSITFAATPAELPADPALVVVAVKSFDTASVLKSLANHLPETTVLASIQNGLGNEDVIAAQFPDHTIVAGSICASLELSRPGHAIWADDRGGLGAALHRGDAEIARVVWQDTMARTGMECRWYPGVNASARLKWSKLMLNIGFNALNSITGHTSAELLRDPVHGELAIAALREGFALMDRLDLHPLDLPGFPVSKLRLLVRLFPRLGRKIMAWQASRSPEAAFSMRQDIVKKRQTTEIQELNGRIVQIGRRFGLKVSANEKLVEMVENFR